MDKNFINIDDLVRQRLGGGEESERAGAWLQMRDLLDKEMPQKKAGFIYWRRMFSAIAVLALISTMSVGGYMYATSIKGNNSNNNATTDNNDLITNASSNTNNASSNTNINANETNNTNQITPIDVAHHSNAGDNEPLSKQNNENKTITLKETNKSLLASNIITTNHKAAHNNKKREAARNRQFIAQLIAANERSKQLASNSKPSANSEVNSTSDAPSGAILIKHSDKVKNTQNNDNAGGNPIYLAGTSSDKHSSDKHASTTSKKHANKLQKESIPMLVAMNNKTAPISTSPSKTNNNNIRTTATNKTAAINMRKLALSSNNPSYKNMTGVSGANIINSNNKLNANKSTVGNTSGASSPMALNGTDKKPTNNNIIKKEVSAVKMGKKVIDRLVMTEHYVKTSSGEGYFKLDTISIESVSEELGINNEPNQSPENSTARKTAATNTSENNEAAQANANTTILPAATTSATGKSGMGIKESQTAKMGSGTTTVEKLSATFNDIKFHIAGAQFAPGLTAGINGTFFGPNSFKGFQFGFTGNIIFSDNLSVLAELKYFHRINNNYSLSDNYYNYVPAAGGQYTKELQPVSYNFSTLHSIEMPISIRYCLSHFNFFVGGNLVYSFAINTGQSTLSNTPIPTPTLVSAPGSDNAPKIKDADFDSKIGVGYLFGISYQVSPNVMLDFRNVQTLWNNANTTGAKIISDQLYKSPSLQVSIGYRLGGNKKNKDQ